MWEATCVRGTLAARACVCLDGAYDISVLVCAYSIRFTVQVLHHGLPRQNSAMSRPRAVFQELKGSDRSRTDAHLSKRRNDFRDSIAFNMTLLKKRRFYRYMFVYGIFFGGLQYTYKTSRGQTPYSLRIIHHVSHTSPYCILHGFY